MVIAKPLARDQTMLNRPANITTKAKADATVAFLNAEEAQDILDGIDDGTGWTYAAVAVNADRDFYRIDIVDAAGAFVGSM